MLTLLSRLPQRFLNAWCELVVGSLSGRCPWIRVSLPNTNLQEKGTDSSCSTLTPSSLHSTSWWTTSATLIHQQSALAQRLPSPKARSLPLLALGLTPVGGHTRVSDVNADEG